MAEMRVVAVAVDPRVAAPVLLLQETAAQHRVAASSRGTPTTTTA
jgi:hypothetical protein